jgi:hypothetical protein
MGHYPIRRREKGRRSWQQEAVFKRRLCALRGTHTGGGAGLGGATARAAGPWHAEGEPGAHDGGFAPPPPRRVSRAPSA